MNYEALHSITDSKSHHGMSVWHKGIVRKYPEKQLKGEELVRRFGQLLQLQLATLHTFRYAWLSHASAAIHTNWYRKCRLCRCSLCCFLCILRDVQNALLGHVDHLKLASVTWVMIFKHQTNSNHHQVLILLAIIGQYQNSTIQTSATDIAQWCPMAAARIPASQELGKSFQLGSTRPASEARGSLHLKPNAIAHHWVCLKIG